MIEVYVFPRNLFIPDSVASYLLRCHPANYGMRALNNSLVVWVVHVAALVQRLASATG